MGSGISGSVHKATYKPTGMDLAIKSIKLYDKNTRNQFKNDLKVLLDSNQCENIVSFYGAFFTEGNVKILLEFMNLGSLDKILKDIKKKKFPPPCIPESILSKITKQILLGLRYLHKEKHQMHRDIKPANILMNTAGVVKLTDFGISRSLENNQISKTFVGTRSYMSPERISGKIYSYSSDIWSLGLVIYELATGKEPYGEGNDFVTQITNIVENDEPRLDNNIFSKELCDFIEKTVKKEPEKRADVEELLNHPWILQHEKDNESISKWFGDMYGYTK